MDYLLYKDIETAVEILKKAIEEKRKEQAFMLYVNLYGQMDETNFISFEEFYQTSHTNTNRKDEKSIEEILEETQAIVEGVDFGII